MTITINADDPRTIKAAHWLPGLRWQRQERALFVGEENIERLLAVGAVDSLPGHIQALAHGFATHHCETRKGPTGEKPCA